MGEILKKHFFFVRHAETDWNSRKLCQGQKDIPLNERGVEDAKRLALEISGFDVDCIITSPLSRALETAKEVQKAHPCAGFYTVPELSERFWGELEGISSEEMYAFERLEEDDAGYSPGKSVEPRAKFRQRVTEGIAAAQRYHPHPLIVSHGRVFTELCHVLSIPPVRQIQNCQLIKIFYSSNGWKSQIL